MTETDPEKKSEPDKKKGEADKKKGGDIAGPREPQATEPAPQAAVKLRNRYVGGTYHDLGTNVRWGDDVGQVQSVPAERAKELLAETFTFIDKNFNSKTEFRFEIVRE